MALAIICALTGWAFAFFLVIQCGKDKADAASSYERSLEWERARSDSLIAQLQANSQGFQHYPTFGPIEAEPEKKYLRDDTGLIEFEVPLDDDADFEAVFD